MSVIHIAWILEMYPHFHIRYRSRKVIPTYIYIQATRPLPEIFVYVLKFKVLCV